MPDQTPRQAGGEPETPRLSAVIDRVEGGMAVIALSDDEIEFDLPLKYLPAGSKEGDHLTLRFEADPAATESTRQRIAALKKDLNRTDPNQTNFKL